MHEWAPGAVPAHLRPSSAAVRWRRGCSCWCRDAGPEQREGRVLQGISQGGEVGAVLVPRACLSTFGAAASQSPSPLVEPVWAPWGQALVEQLLPLASLDSTGKIPYFRGDPGTACPNSAFLPRTAPAPRECGPAPAHLPRRGIRWEKFLWAVTDRRLWWGCRHTPI